MKILVPGDKNRLRKYKKFKCMDCGCVFIADKGEYKDQSTQRDGPMFAIECPCCGRTTWTYTTQTVTESEAEAGEPYWR